MSQVFPAQNPGDGNIGVKIFRDDTGAVIVSVLPFGSLIVVEDNAPENDQRIKSEVRMNVASSPIPGWVNKNVLGPPLPPQQIGALLNPFRLDLFVLQCATAELSSSTGGTDGPNFAASADFLIALGLLESGLSVDTGSLVEGDRVGPYRFTADEWQEFIAENPDGRFDIFDRFLPLMQIPAAVYYATKYFAEYKILAEQVVPPAPGAPVPDQPFIPSFLNLFHSWLLGPEAALKVLSLHDGDDPNQPLKLALAALVPDLNARLEKYKSIAKVDDATSVDAYVEATSLKLDEALAKAFRLLREHASEFVAKPTSLNAPWMDEAEKQRMLWNLALESTSAGRQRTIDYFKEINIASNGDLAWCGAFVAHCMLNSGNAAAAASLPGGPARAANWKGWGNRALRVGDPNLPVGAVVVLTPSPGTNTSGHVTFLKKVMPGGTKIECLGGNQSNTCKIETYAISRVAAIRWLDIAGSPPGPVEGAMPAEERMTFAQTLYGEARGETREGREAVANVIMNRAALRPRYGDTPASVCRKKWQFSCWNDNDPNRAVINDPAQQATPVFAECLAIAEVGLAGNLQDRTGGATHYHSRSIAKPSWALSVAPGDTLVIGGHIFYRNVP